jgi:hypothetical protein
MGQRKAKMGHRTPRVGLQGLLEIVGGLLAMETVHPYPRNVAPRLANRGSGLMGKSVRAHIKGVLLWGVHCTSAQACDVISLS